MNLQFVLVFQCFNHTTFLFSLRIPYLYRPIFNDPTALSLSSSWWVSVLPKIFAQIVFNPFFFFFSFLNSGALIIETNWLSNCFHAFSQSRPALPRTLSLIVLVLVIIICNPGLIDPRPNIFFFSFTFWEWYCKDFSLFTCTLWSSD